MKKVSDMNFQEYKKLIKDIQIGKHLPIAIYLHESAIDSLPIVLQNFLQKTIEELDLSNVSWNLIKLSKKDFKISLLYYPTFFQDSYPPLHSSNTIDLEKGSFRKSSYGKSTNPPILHRKETFLKPDHPSVQLFREITKEGEEAGLYKNTRTIGFKKSWERLIAQNGLMLIEGRLQKKSERGNFNNVRCLRGTENFSMTSRICALSLAVYRQILNLNSRNVFEQFAGRSLYQFPKIPCKHFLGVPLSKFSLWVKSLALGIIDFSAMKVQKPFFKSLRTISLVRNKNF